MSDEEIARRSRFVRPIWLPQVEPGTRILIAGASGGIGRALVQMLVEGSDCIIGAHAASHPLDDLASASIHPLRRTLGGETDCVALIRDFVDRVGGVDALVVLTGRLTRTEHWDELNGEDWQRDVHDNLNIPFFLARAAMRNMKEHGKGGRIVLNGTESALHGGSAQSFPYAVAKRGVETLVQGLAREGARHAILVNGVRLGYIKSGFHQRWSGRTEQDMVKRAALVPLKRGGEPEEAAALMTYLLSGWAGFITGQMFALTGGDWL